MLNWTGHALVDVGIATLCAMSGREDPASLTPADLDAAADEMERYYFSGVLASYLTCVFMNSEYVQPGSGSKKKESRKRYADRVLRAHRWQVDDDAAGRECAFSGEAATHVIHRGQMPLLTGEGVLNFFAAGAGGLYIAGPYLTALQALPLGGRRSEGKLLIAHSDSPPLTLAFARRFLEDNRRLLGLALSAALPDKEGPDQRLEREHASYDSAKKRPKYPDAKAAFTMIASDLLDIVRGSSYAGGADTPASLDVYWLSSSGQGPSLEIFNVPSDLIRFLRKVSQAETSAGWSRLVARGWESQGDPARNKKGGKSSGVALVGAGRSRNPVLADLLDIYENGSIDSNGARRFVRRHLLFYNYGTIKRPEAPNWELTELFLTEVLGMTAERIEQIREFADKLAEYIANRNDRSFFRAVAFAKRPWEVRNALVKAQRNEYLAGRDLLFTLDDYLTVFEAEDSAGIADWSLVRDLISIRMIETLHGKQSLTDEMLAEEAGEQQSVGA
jgi:CRISPR-associated protein Cst1